MAKYIKSIYILNHIFSYISDIKKFELLKYNKNFQNQMNINIINYKLLSGKYFQYITKNSGKLYDAYEDTIIYEGGYLKGKKNGVGKEFYKNGKVKYEGEYLNGKRNGKGKKYDVNGLLEFEGEYLNGKKWNGKYNKNHIKTRIKFEGDYINGKFTGKGIQYDIFGKKI